MNKQKILELTGLSEDQFYDQYPDQETFCSDYPDACNQLDQAQGGMQVDNGGMQYDRIYDKNGNETFTPAPDPIHSDWQINDEGMNVRPRTVDRFGNAIGPTTQVLRIPINRFPFNGEPTMQRLNPAMQSLQHESANNVPVTSPIDVLTPLIARYSLPKGMIQNSIPIEKLSVKQTMQSVGSTGAPYTAPVNKYESIVDLLKSRKMDSSMDSRKKLAEELNIKNYTGTAAQNMLLLNQVNNLNQVDNTPSVNQPSLENYLAPPQVAPTASFKYNPGKYPNINDVSTRNLNNSPVNIPQKGIVQPVKKTVPILKTPVQNPYYKNYIYSGPTNLGCKGKYCAEQVSNELESMGLKPQRTNSWFMRDKVLKNGGKEIWNTNNRKNIDYKQLHVGDVVSLDRPLLHFEEEMKTNNPNKYNIEHIEHVGVVVGFDKNGTPLIKHGGITEDTVVQPITSLRLLNKENGAVLNYKPTSIYRVPGASNEKISNKYSNAHYNHNTIVNQEQVKKDQKEYINDRFGSKFKTGGSWMQEGMNNKFYEQGGTAIFPSMRNFKQGGYYGMDQKFHPNSDSGTYVTGAGYYFDTGGGTTASPASAPGTSGGVDVSGVPGAGAAGVTNGIRADGSFAVNDSKMPDGGYDGSGMMGDSAYEQSSPFDYNSSQFSEQSADKQQPYDQQQQPPVYDPSQYSSEIDPSTGFTKYKKNGLAIRNIKREDPALWNHLKDEGHGARWATGQTDFQRVGRTAGAIGQGLEAGINVAGAIGGYLNNRNKQRNMDKSAINMGSTTSMFTNPQGSGKGDYGVTGSTYGQFKPNQVSNMSFKGMYGKYGMQVPKYAVGGFEPQISTLSDNSLMNNDARELPLYEINKLYSAPIIENYKYNIPSVVKKDDIKIEDDLNNETPLNNSKPVINKNSNNLDVDIALQAIAGIESGSKRGETKAGMRTKLVGEGGKRASASGTYQITTGTLQEIFNKDKNINSKYKNFNNFKSAFNTDPTVEYAAAKSLMSDHIKNYGIYALGAWYQPEFARRAMQGDKSVFNIVPRKDYGNKVKWGDDFQLKLNAYNNLANTNYDISSLTNTKSSSVNIKSSSVNIKNLHPDLLNFTNVISQNFPGLVLTSGNDSKHMKGSKHYGNKAIDIGANSSNKQAYANLKKYLKSNSSIKQQFGIEDIIDEGNHIHVELMKYGGQQQGGQVVDMEEDDIKQFLAAGGQLEFLD